MLGESVQTECEECMNFSGYTAQCNKTNTEDSVCLLNGVHSEFSYLQEEAENHLSQQRACKESPVGKDPKKWELCVSLRACVYMSGDKISTLNAKAFFLQQWE